MSSIIRCSRSIRTTAAARTSSALPARQHFRRRLIHLGYGEQSACIQRDRRYAGNNLYNQIVNMVNAQKTASGALPANFYTVPLAANFWATPANNFNITTLDGYKQYQLRTTYTTGFGTLYNNGTPRYIQLGIKLYF